MKYKILLSLFILLFIACNKDNKVTPTTTTPILPPNLGVITSQLKDINSHQFVVLTVKNVELKDSVYSGTFGGKELSLYKSNDTSMVFLTPDLPTGKHTLKLEKVGNSVEFNVTQTVLNDSPENIILKYYNEASRIRNVLIEKIGKNGFDETTKAEIDNLNASSSSQLEILINSPSDEKLEEAKVLQANAIYFNNLLKALDESNNLKTGRVGQVQNDIQNAKNELYLFGGASATIGIVAGIAGGYLLKEGKSAPQRILGLALLGLTVSIIHSWKIALNNIAIRPLVSQAWDNLFNGRIMTQSFKNNTAVSTKLSLLKTTLQKNGAKEGSKDWVIKYFNLVDGINIILDFLHFSLIQNHLKSTNKSPEHSDLLNLVIDNPRVKGEISGTQNNYQVTFSTDEKEDQDFGYKVIYDDTEFKVESALYQAKLEVSGSKPKIISLSKEIVSKLNQNGNKYYELYVIVEYEITDKELIENSSTTAVSYCNNLPEKNYEWCGQPSSIQETGSGRGRLWAPQGFNSEPEFVDHGAWEFTITDANGNKSEPAVIGL